MAIIAILIALLLPSVQQAREAVRRTQCKSHFKQIGLALHNYESSHRLFPPGIVGSTGTPAAGQPHTTWLTLILPLLDQAPLHQRYDFNVPFNHANNASVVSQRLTVYMCPSQPNEQLVDNLYAPSHYASNAGTILASNDGLLFPLSATRMRDVIDGTTQTLAAGEIAFDFRGWARGSDSTSAGGGGGGGGGGGEGGAATGFGFGVLRWWKAAANCARPGINPPQTTCSNSAERKFQFSSPHTGGCHFVLADGSTRFVSENIDVIVLRALTTRAGREVVGEF